MIRLVYHPNFLHSGKLLPKTQREKLSKLLVLIRENPFHPLLHTKRLTGALSGLLTFRITRDWRVLFCFLAPDCIQLLRVRHRRDMYQ